MLSELIPQTFVRDAGIVQNWISKIRIVAGKKGFEGSCSVLATVYRNKQCYRLVCGDALDGGCVGLQRPDGKILPATYLEILCGNMVFITIPDPDPDPLRGATYQVAVVASEYLKTCAFVEWTALCRILESFGYGDEDLDALTDELDDGGEGDSGRRLVTLRDFADAVRNVGLPDAIEDEEDVIRAITQLVPYDGFIDMQN